jgi:hypothetical protein
MDETWFAEMKRYVRFGPDDEAALRRLTRFAAPEFRRIADEFYERLDEHPRAKAVFTGPEQVERLKVTLCEWMRLLLDGPWDEAYHAQRARIGRVHVAIGLPQKYMFGAVNLIRVDLLRIAQRAHAGDEPAPGPGSPAGTDLIHATVALQKVLDLELGIMLETYREAFVERAQLVARMETALLAERLAASEARHAEIAGQPDEDPASGHDPAS